MPFGDRKCPLVLIFGSFSREPWAHQLTMFGILCLTSITSFERKLSHLMVDVQSSSFEIYGKKGVLRGLEGTFYRMRHTR